MFQWGEKAPHSINRAYVIWGKSWLTDRSQAKSISVEPLVNGSVLSEENPKPCSILHQCARNKTQIAPDGAGKGLTRVEWCEWEDTATEIDHLYTQFNPAIWKSYVYGEENHSDWWRDWNVMDWTSASLKAWWIMWWQLMETETSLQSFEFGKICILGLKDLYRKQITNWVRGACREEI